jgi:uncharacterized protein YdeI (YjbR/CyaY-like superfamily)
VSGPTERVAHHDREKVHAETVGHWRDWLGEHHETHDGVWLISWRAGTGRPRMTYDEAVEEALAVGWVDGVSATIDDDRSMLWFTRRRPTSAWSRPNKVRVERLEAQGRMRPAGRHAVDTAVANGSWSRLDEVEDLVVPADLATALAAYEGARAHWDAFPRTVRRGILEWIITAKRDATRAGRVAETAEHAARGERAHQWRPRESR